MEISIYRYNPDTDNAPYMQDFDLEIPGGKDLMVLDVLELLKEKDPSVTYRRSCREGGLWVGRGQYERKKWFGLHNASL